MTRSDDIAEERTTTDARGRKGAPSTPDARTLQQLARLGAHVGEVASELRVPLQLVLGSLDQLASQVDLIGRSAPPGDAEEAGDLVRLCREGVRRMAELVEQVVAHGRGAATTPVPGPVDVCRLVRVIVDVVARAIPRAPSIALDLPALPPLRTDERLLGPLMMHVIRHVVEEAAGTRDATVDVATRAGSDADVEIMVTGRCCRSTGGRLALGMGLARDLAGALRGDVEVIPSNEDTIVLLIRIPAMP